ncbi:hypothetical protein BAUCODRAFT_307726 [Baudoinia panamericana UAMH 10762]|uniref:Alpha/beta hydrolase fold-3 domain-containing protein n=1 Tax=Baudoinia panamericana (strain UAMH 10762) TaxID=717646 RepID=M2MZV2_BAUPA|nr:uncharacterized protein BAUCODRAFT_307726 [Baudoinia panamericana UAMH 10762]EMC91855.1 hypothetical protein BAUCODRAFT_307726 [Baudoinia panamericana UAMH 10762]
MPLAQSWLDFENSVGGRSQLKGTPEEIRAQYDGLIQALMPLYSAPSDAVESKDFDADGVKVRGYWPKGTTGELPAGIWTHGGGWVVGDINGDDLLCRAVSEHNKVALLSVEYRLAPEHKWPAQLDDCMTAYKWAHKNASSFHADANKFFTIGGSAGGGLALSTANQVIQDSSLKSSLKGIAAIVPVAVHWDSCPDKYKSKYTAYKDNAEDAPVINKQSMADFFKITGVDPNDENTFTSLATKNHKNFPPTYFASCEFDPLRDDATVMEAALKDAGVETKHDHYKGFPHYFWIVPTVPESQTFVQNLVGGIEWLKSKM